MLCVCRQLTKESLLVTKVLKKEDPYNNTLKNLFIDWIYHKQNKSTCVLLRLIRNIWWDSSEVTTP